MKIPRVRDANALDGLLSLALCGVGAGMLWGWGYGFLVPGGLLFISVTLDDVRQPRGS